MKTGFAVISRPTGVEFRLYTPTPDDLGPAGDPWLSLINFARTGGSAAVLMGRLYYRQEQLQKLDAPPTELAAAMARNDAALALAVYHRTGVQGLETLEGDFSLVIWDARRQLLLGMRDPNGGYPLFWIERDGLVALASGLPPLLELLPQRKINMSYVADFLMLPGSNGDEMPYQQTVYEGINRLLPASTLTVRRTGDSAKIEQRVYWDWRQHVTTPRGKTLEEIGGEYEHLLRAAVRERMRGRTAAHFSGGMDSTAIALLARDEAVRAGTAPVLAVALIYKRMEVLSRETQYLEGALAGQSGLEALRIPGDDVLDFAMLVNPPAHDEPWTSLNRGGLSAALLDAAAAAGAKSVFSGIGSDELLDGAPFHLSDLVRRGRWISAWREAARWARGRDASPWAYLHPLGITPLLPVSMRDGVGRWMSGAMRSLLRRPVRFRDQTHTTVPPWILPEFAARHGLRKRGVAEAKWLFKGVRAPGMTAAQRIGLTAVRSRHGDMSRWHSAAPLGIHIAHPFLDPRVISLGLGIPDLIRASPGVQKPVLGQAMRNVLPENIRIRRHKGHFNEVYNLGLSHYLSDLENIIADSPVDELGIFDKKIMQNFLNQAAVMGGGNILAEERLNLSLSIMQWVRMSDGWIANQPAPAETIVIAPRPQSTS